MYRTYSSLDNHQELTIQTAFHEAGHAASIYFGNKEKQLPPVFFQIKITTPTGIEGQLYSAKVIDGQLIQNLPVAGLESTQLLPFEEQKEYRSAFEADVINLLVGPLAEAKYVSLRDDELFSINLLNIHALNYYGGSSDIKKAYAYLKFFISSERHREIKMQELFLQAFRFVDNEKNWLSISRLAQFILNSEKEILSCEEVVNVFEQLSA